MAKKGLSFMGDSERLRGDDINDPDHRAEPAELAMGVFAALSALATAAVIELFHPKRRVH